MMEFDADERAFLDEMRMLTTDNAGHEVYVGLTVEESAELYRFTRLSHSFNGDSEAQDRFLALDEKMQKARFAVLAAEMMVRDHKPTQH